MLFSEPKIPQSSLPEVQREYRVRFSALQRAENSSIDCLARRRAADALVSVLFSEPKIPQYQRDAMPHRQHARFSALQRAENSSINLQYPRVR